MTVPRADVFPLEELLTDELTFCDEVLLEVGAALLVSVGAIV